MPIGEALDALATHVPLREENAAAVGAATMAMLASAESFQRRMQGRVEFMGARPMFVLDAGYAERSGICTRSGGDLSTPV